MRIYLSTLEVLLMQELLIKRYGGLSGVRDLGAAEMLEHMQRWISARENRYEEILSTLREIVR